MQLIDRFVIEEETPDLSSAVVADRESGSRFSVGGVRIAGQYRVDDLRSLIVLDENCPYEEQLHFILVSGGAPVDEIVYGAPYTPGLFRPLDCSGSALRFHFASDDVMELIVRERRQWRLRPGVPGARYPGVWAILPARRALSLRMGET